ncbi:helix-turn-helix XRE-family transcriptional regulators [Candidatus Termititenax persephonae]|uniref:Helix-turn-helix XRE-family transcriptional regulators n=1 Tax=Candidatus Termititenax persephonae TaxID=2218525 RepID=A0A388TJ05_9BACT|nr:helix-turn-helix XRE-family transcriptional regulators [Candidatus Termititenax persephonae]
MDKEITNAEIKKLLSKKLATLRKDSGQTLEATADELNLDLSEYFRILKGQRLPQLRTLLRINKKYGLNMDWWFKELEETAVNEKHFRQKAIEAQLLSLLRKLDLGSQEVVLSLARALVKKAAQENY